MAALAMSEAVGGIVGSPPMRRSSSRRAITGLLVGTSEGGPLGGTSAGLLGGANGDSFRGASAGLVGGTSGGPLGGTHEGLLGGTSAGPQGGASGGSFSFGGTHGGSLRGPSKRGLDGSIGGAFGGSGGGGPQSGGGSPARAAAAAAAAAAVEAAKPSRAGSTTASGRRVADVPVRSRLPIVVVVTAPEGGGPTAGCVAPGPGPTPLQAAASAVPAGGLPPREPFTYRVLIPPPPAAASTAAAPASSPMPETPYRCALPSPTAAGVGAAEPSQVAAAPALPLGTLPPLPPQLPTGIEGSPPRVHFDNQHCDAAAEPTLPRPHLLPPPSPLPLPPGTPPAAALTPAPASGPPSPCTCNHGDTPRPKGGTCSSMPRSASLPPRRPAPTIARPPQGRASLHGTPGRSPAARGAAASRMDAAARTALLHLALPLIAYGDADAPGGTPMPLRWSQSLRTYGQVEACPTCDGAGERVRVGAKVFTLLHPAAAFANDGALPPHPTDGGSKRTSGCVRSCSTSDEPQRSGREGSGVGILGAVRRRAAETGALLLPLPAVAPPPAEHDPPDAMEAGAADAAATLPSLPTEYLPATAVPHLGGGAGGYPAPTNRASDGVVSQPAMRLAPAPAPVAKPSHLVARAPAPPSLPLAVAPLPLPTPPPPPLPGPPAAPSLLPPRQAVPVVVAAAAGVAAGAAAASAAAASAAAVPTGLPPTAGGHVVSRPVVTEPAPGLARRPLAHPHVPHPTARPVAPPLAAATPSLPAPPLPPATQAAPPRGPAASEPQEPEAAAATSLFASQVPADIDAAAEVTLDDISPAFLPIVDSIHERLAALRAKCEGDLGLLDDHDRAQESIYRRALEVELERARRVAERRALERRAARIAASVVAARVRSESRDNREAAGAAQLRACTRGDDDVEAAASTTASSRRRVPRRSESQRQGKKEDEGEEGSVEAMEALEDRGCRRSRGGSCGSVSAREGGSSGSQGSSSRGSRAGDDDVEAAVPRSSIRQRGGVEDASGGRGAAAGSARGRSGQRRRDAAADSDDCGLRSTRLPAASAMFTNVAQALHARREWLCSGVAGISGSSARGIVPSAQAALPRFGDASMTRPMHFVSSPAVRTSSYLAGLLPPSGSTGGVGGSSVSAAAITAATAQAPVGSHFYSGPGGGGPHAATLIAAAAAAAAATAAMSVAAPSAPPYPPPAAASTSSRAGVPHATPALAVPWAADSYRLARGVPPRRQRDPSPPPPAPPTEQGRTSHISDASLAEREAEVRRLYRSVMPSRALPASLVPVATAEL